MAVVVKYVVVRNGEEKMTFATKKEADAHDKMLDIADNLYDFLGKCDEPLIIDETQRETIALYIAKNSDLVINILKGIPVKQSPSIAAGIEEDANVQEEEGASFLKSVPTATNVETGDDAATVLEEDDREVLEPPPVEKKRGGKSKGSVAA